MKNIFTTALFLLASFALYAQNEANPSKTGGITFVVDEGLTPIMDEFKMSFDGEEIIAFMMRKENVPDNSFKNIRTSSFANDKHILSFGMDAFYQCVKYAYAHHRSLEFSPDMIWLLISQGFARYVNEHPEEMRDRLVYHKGKKDIVVQVDNDLLADSVDWQKVIGGFAKEIEKNTKKDIAGILTADFSTTSPTELLASQVTLMETTKAYFNYVAISIACGIPSITLQGTPADWKNVLEKTQKLSDYGMKSWIDSLVPILKEFIAASEGKPNQKFWQGMVKKQRVDELEGGGCIPGTPTELDGWILQFFPDANGRTPESVYHTEKMPKEYVRTGFKYIKHNPVSGVAEEYPMELWAGFVGATEDTLTNTLTPKVGWFVRVSETNDDILEQMKQHDGDGELRLRVSEVPEALLKAEHIKSLILEFTDKVLIPQWMDKLLIDNFSIEGSMTEEEKTELQQRFPKARIINDNIKK